MNAIARIASTFTDAEDVTAELPLARLAYLVRARHAEAQKFAHEATRCAIEVGRLLLAAKSKVKHGEWLPWLTEHCQLAVRTAQNYMRLAVKAAAPGAADAPRVAHLPVREAIKTVAGPSRRARVQPAGGDASKECATTPSPLDARRLRIDWCRVFEQTALGLTSTADSFDTITGHSRDALIEAISRIEPDQARVWGNEIAAALARLRDVAVLLRDRAGPSTGAASRGRALANAHAAVAQLQSIPTDDGLRDEALDTVARWIEDNA